MFFQVTELWDLGSYVIDTGERLRGCCAYCSLLESSHQAGKLAR